MKKQAPSPLQPAGQPAVPPAKLLDLIGSSREDFAGSGRHFLQIFRNHAGLTPSDRVLDVGCGCGRMALPLAGYLTTGSYDGFDVVPDLVAWCRENIASRHRNFHFAHADLASYRYHSRGILPAAQFRFPYPDETFDFTFLTSIFTHMLPGSLAYYTAEIARTLKPGGTALITFFILNDESRRLERTPQSRIRFRYPYWRGGGVMLKSLLSPEAAVAHPEDSVREILGRNGLEVQKVLFGNWCGRKGAVSFQDIFIVRKIGSGTSPSVPASGAPPSGWVLVESRLGHLGRHYSSTLQAHRLSRPGDVEKIPVLVPADGRVHQLVKLPDDTGRLDWCSPGGTLIDPSQLTIRRVGWLERTFHMAARVVMTYPLISRERKSKSGLTLQRALFDLPGAYRLAILFYTAYPWSEYPDWIERFDALEEQDILQIRTHIGRFAGRPHLHLLVASGGNRKAIQATLASLREQLFRDFTCTVLDSAGATDVPVIADAELKDVGTGSRFVAQSTMAAWLAAFNASLDGRQTDKWIMLLRAGDRLPAHALYWFACAALERPDATIVYSDDDAVDASGLRRDPRFKPDWSPAHLRSTHYIGSAAILRGDAVAAAGGVSFDCSRHGNYELLLRVGDSSEVTPVHVPVVLFHRGSEADAGDEWEAPQWCVDMLQTHLARIGVAAKVEPTLPGCWRVRYRLPDTAPLVSIVVPTRNATALLRQCLESVLERTAYPRLEILVVDNQSNDPETLAYLEKIAGHPAVRVLRYDRAFNYSAINNFAAREARGEALCLLNNDTEVISPYWLEDMVGHLLQEGVGAVGARLLYPDGRVQHAGVTMGPSGGADHPHAYCARNEPGYCNRAVLAQEFSAVTAACLLTWKRLYQSLGGLNEKDLPVAFNDVDYCLRLQEAGYRVILDANAELFHHESATRGREDTIGKRIRAWRERKYLRAKWAACLKHDPYYNPNLSYHQPDFSLSVMPQHIKKPWLAE